MTADHPDLVDEDYRPYIRTLGNLVIMFAQCEAALLSLTAELNGGDELKAVDVLKAQDAKDQVISLIRSTELSGFDLDELVIGIGEFWCDKNIRNRLIHDEWYPNILTPGEVGTRGLTRKKNPERGFYPSDGARGLGVGCAVWLLRTPFLSPQLDAIAQQADVTVKRVLSRLC